MIDIRLKYQASVFGDMSEIKPTPENTKILIDLFSDKELMPSSFHEASASGLRPRLAFESTNGEWNIRLATRRIDIEKRAFETHGEGIGELKGFCGEAASLFEKITDEFNKKKVSRIALVTNFLLEDMPLSALSDVYLRLFNTTEFYKENPPFEWHWQAASKKPITLESLNENLNVLTTIKREQGEFQVGGEVKPFDRVQLSLDINTSPENKEHRFEPLHISDFYRQAIELHDELLIAAEEFINGQSR